jgi:hypothetical protein
MKKFIAYFDYLGFKQFIENNDLNYQKKVVGDNFRDIESALGKGKYKEAPHGVIADLSYSKINCINFSDTVVFWTNDDSENSLLEILEVAHKFNWQAIDFFFPARGSVVYGEIEYVDFKQKNEAGGLYNINSVFGKGLVKAHEKAEKQHWAGTVIDDSFIKELISRGYDIETFLKPYAKKFKVPYKNGFELPDEFVMRIIKGQLNDEAFKNYGNGIRENFARHNKLVDKQDVRDKIENTIKFLASFYDKEL